MAAVSTLNTISKLIDALEQSPNDLVGVSNILLPILEHCLSSNGQEFF